MTAPTSFRIVPLGQIRDARGLLTVGEVGKQIPFTPVRFFTIGGVPAGQRRAEHAHRTLKEFFVCFQGACTATLDDGTTREEFRLQGCDRGIYKPPMVWVVLHSFTADAVVLALASKIWTDDDHIKDYETFVRMARESRT